MEKWKVKDESLMYAEFVRSFFYLGKYFTILLLDSIKLTIIV